MQRIRAATGNWPLALAVFGIAFAAGLAAYILLPWPGSAGAGDPGPDAAKEATSVSIALAEYEAAHQAYVACVEASSFISVSTSRGEGLRPSRASFEVSVDEHDDDYEAKEAAGQVIDDCRAENIDGPERALNAARVITEQDIYDALDRVRECIDQGLVPEVPGVDEQAHGMVHVIHYNNKELRRTEIRFDQTQLHDQCSLMVQAETGVPPQPPYYTDIDGLNVTWHRHEELLGNAEAD